MGLETEKADVQLFMADDAYSHHSGVDYADPEKYVDSSHDRDPHQLNSHLKDPDAFCEDLPNGLAFRADNMEECDRRCHWPIVYKCGPQLLIGQHATEPRLTTQTLGRSRHLDTVQLY
uniref:Caveolin 2 n=1 Tax=Mus musculus TaxID=10090 RepID=D3Z147_MOUSE